MPRCRVKDCPEDATGFVSIHVPNTATENYDAVNPVRVDVCTGHMRVISSPPGLPLVSLRFDS